MNLAWGESRGQEQLEGTALAGYSRALGFRGFCVSTVSLREGAGGHCGPVSRAFSSRAGQGRGWSHARALGVPVWL